MFLDDLSFSEGTLGSAVFHGYDAVKNAHVSRTVRTDRNGSVTVVPVDAVAGVDLEHGLARAEIDRREIPCDRKRRDLFVIFSRVKINETRFDLTFYNCPMVSVTDILFRRFNGAFMPAATDRIKNMIMTAISMIGSCHTE